MKPQYHIGMDIFVANYLECTNYKIISKRQKQNRKSMSTSVSHRVKREMAGYFTDLGCAC